jgi:hypothetical protein
MVIQPLPWRAKKCPYSFINARKQLKIAEKERLNAIIRADKFLYA